MLTRSSWCNCVESRWRQSPSTLPSCNISKSHLVQTHLLTWCLSVITGLISHNYNSIIELHSLSGAHSATLKYWHDAVKSRIECKEASYSIQHITVKSLDKSLTRSHHNRPPDNSLDCYVKIYSDYWVSISPTALHYATQKLLPAEWRTSRQPMLHSLLPTNSRPVTEYKLTLKSTQIRHRTKLK